MVDITFYLTIATIIATVAGAMTGLASSFFSARMQNKQLKIQEGQTELSNQVQWANMGMQLSAQFNTMLQDSYAKRDELSEINRKLKLENTDRDLRMTRAVSHIEELLEEHNTIYEGIGKECSFYTILQTELTKLLTILAEVSRG